LAYLLQAGYHINHLIHSPYERRRDDNSLSLEEWQEFNSLKEKFLKNGTKVYAPYRQNNLTEPYWMIDEFSFKILGPHKEVATSNTRECHDASLVIWLAAGSHRLCFTGDASDKNLNMIANSTKGISKCILHASHHGSINGADLDFIKKASPKETVISTKSGVYENVPHPTALARYNRETSEGVYRTDVEQGLMLQIG
jgi:beta-lactamase superfamily II metal-dependent hydrolase